MNTQRITISIPKYLYEDLVRILPPRQISSFATQALEKELAVAETDPIEDFIQLKKKLPYKEKRRILAAIRKGRL